jgi:3-hydroxyisobutyrate dehydrogenase-like beta-hydroxyacid dehydrogenase
MDVGFIGVGRMGRVMALDLRLGLKDAKLMLAAGEEANVPLPFVSVLRGNYLDALAHGDAAKDWSAVTQVALRRAGPA